MKPTCRYIATAFFSLHRIFACFIVIIFSGFNFHSSAQGVTLIPHVSGSAQLGGTVVTVSHTGQINPNIIGWCGLQAQHIGNQYDSIYYYKFSNPTSHVRFAFTVTEYGEEMYFKVNGVFYPLTNNHISKYGASTCTCQAYAFTSAGKMVFPMVMPTQNCTQVDIYYPGIDSVSVHHKDNGSGGSIFNAFFSPDTTTFIRHPFTDTIKCQGDSLGLVYSTNFRFNNNNTFTAQLSNASGSFANPVNIGSRADTTGDTIWCKIPVNTPAGNGYRVRIVSTSPVDTSLDNQVNIRIKAAPANFSNNSNSPVCTGDTLHLTGSCTSTGITWLWTGPGSFSSSAKDTFIANAQLADSGKYILKATLNSTGCSLYDTSTVEMRPTPTKPTAGSNSPVCETLPLTLTTSSSTSGVSYSWQGPGSYSSSTQNPTVTTSASSTHAGDYISTATLNGCSSKDTTTVVVLPKPAKPTAAATNSPLCARQDLQLTASTVTGASYAWYGPSAFTANTQNPVRTNVQMADAGKYYVYATVNGCVSDTDSVAVVVNTDPFVNIFPTPGASVCQGQQVVYTAIPTNGGTSPSYNWLVNGIATGSTGTTYNTATLNNGDAVSCAMTSTGTCATPFVDTSNAITMTVQPILTPTVTMTADKMPPWNGGLTVTFTATPTHGGTAPEYQWKRNGQDITGATSATWGVVVNALNDNEDICVVLKSSYECAVPDTAMSNCITTAFTGLGGIVRDKNIKIYPNPVSGILHIEGVEAGSTIELIDVLGRSARKQLLTAQGTVDVSSLLSGVYVLRVDGIVAGRVVKE
ncbi:MAG: T9SS type A sorting domain-containing protein [Taibaiella sp.]|nr:T9SS type A sorting domain-containing protein [Taibaiella sp.]